MNGFESSTKKLGITTTYTHAALAANTDGQYQVRVAGTTKEYTIGKKAKLTSGMELKTGVSVALVYGEGGTLDAAATEDAIVRAKSVKPADAALTVEYYASATSGSLGSAGKDWMPIAGGKSGLLTYPTISEGEQQIRLTYAGNKNYAKTEIVVTVDVKGRGLRDHDGQPPCQLRRAQGRQGKLVWKQNISKISAADAANADFMAELTVNGVAAADQSSVHVLYSDFTSKWKPYSSTTTPPTEPGRYVMTVVVLGGDYVASPVTRTFQITK